MKQCFKCGETKPLDEFYKQPGNSDGRAGKCKTCAKRDVRANRKKKINYYREYDKKRSMREDRVAARKAYLNTEAGRRAAKRAHQTSKERYPNADKARNAVNNAIRDGRLIKPDHCDECGKACNPHGHHDDYDKPLEVRWLCTTCHRQWHIENGPGANAS